MSNRWKEYFERLLNVRHDKEVKEKYLGMVLLKVKETMLRILAEKRLGMPLER